MIINVVNPTMKSVCFYVLLLLTFVGFSQNRNYTSQDISINTHVDGTLLIPNNSITPPLTIIITDSGPTDRNGNQNFQNNNAIKKLAEALANHNIASFRYDKRVVKQIRKGSVNPNISFDDFIEDAKNTIAYFKEQNNFSSIIVIGHGQGSLVGLEASKTSVNKFISIAGSGKTIDKVIIDQVAQMDPSLEKSTIAAFEELKKGKRVNDYPQALGSIFSQDVQPFMMNWIQYDPQIAISELEIPILIINGTKDLQVPVSEAELLKERASSADLKLIENMNHVLFIIEGKELENSKSYNESFRNISDALVQEIVDFIRN